MAMVSEVALTLLMLVLELVGIWLHLVMLLVVAQLPVVMALVGQMQLLKLVPQYQDFLALTWL